jgi:hypothetical protein
VTEQVAYSNVSDVDVTLELAVEVTDEEGNPAAEGIVTTSASSVTVPAGGTSTVDVTVDVSAGAPSLYGGFITGRSADGEVVVRTPVGFYKEPEMYNLTVNAIARDGRPAFGISLVDVVDAVDTTRYLESSFHFEGAPTFRLPPGTYSVMGFIFTYDEPQVFAEEVTMVGDPEVQITGDTTLTLDGTGAGEVVADTPRDTEPRSTSVSYFRAAAERGSFSSAFLVSPPIDRVFAAPTEPVTLGDFEFYTKWRLAAPDLEIGVAKPGSLELDANYMSGSPRLDGRDRAELVFAGLGRPEDFEGIDAQGKIALISRGELTFAQKAANAAAAGAVMAIIHNNRPGLLLGFVGQSEIPTLSISQAQGLELRELLEAGRVTLEMRGIAISPYIYDLIFPEPDRILESHRHTIDNSNTVRTNARYNAHVDPWLAGEAHHAFRPWSFFSVEFAHNVDVPQSRTEFVNVGDTRWQHMAWGSMTSEHIFEAFLQEPLVTYADRGTISDDWFEQPLHPGVVEAFEVGADNGFPLRREGDALVFFIPEYVDSQGRWGFKNFSGTDTTSFRLFRNGELVAEADRGFGEFAVPPEPSRYRAELDVSRTAPYWRMSSQVETAWTFDSAQPPPGVEEILPVLLVGYDLGELDGLNRAPRGEHAIDLFVGRQNGASPSEVTEVSVWASFDDGATWSSLPVEPRGGGSFTATVQNPQDESVEYVSLRVQASDSGGSEISQTIVRAYGLE